jgi:hypothetical protein
MVLGSAYCRGLTLKKYIGDGTKIYPGKSPKVLFYVTAHVMRYFTTDEKT